MSLLFGTPDGVYRSQAGDPEDVELVLSTGTTLRVRTFENHGVFAATNTGLYHSEDAGATWTDLGVPRSEVTSVVVGPDGTRLFAGTRPAHVYVSTDGGDTWTELEGFQELPSRDRWPTRRHGGAALVRSLCVHHDAPERVVAGVEVGGVHVSEDGGETWSERRDGLQAARNDDLQYDVHHVLLLDADTFVVSCGGGLYRTRDVGRSWTCLDEALGRPFFQSAFAVRDRLYTASQTLPPTLPMGSRFSLQDVDAALLESMDGGDTLEAVSYPGRPSEHVSAWAMADGRVLGGTTEGRLIVRADDGWTTLGFVPAWIRSLAVA